MALLPVEEAIARVTGGLTPLKSERVALGAALGRVLAEDLTAARDQPPFAASAMDGYAVRASDVETLPARLRIIGEVPAGRPFEHRVDPGEAVRIFTGGVVPQGADLVVIQENTVREGNNVTITAAPGTNPYIRPKGFDFSNGERVLSAGSLLTPPALALAASLNAPEVAVRKRPRVAIMASGDELVKPGTTPEPGQIISSNNVGLAALVSALGAIPQDLGIARDTMADLRRTAGKAQDADILITLGGASVGDHDLVRPALEEMGLRLDFWRIAMRPGKPLMFGAMGDTKVLGLPGNPVSAFVCSHVFLRPMIARLLGARGDGGQTRRAVLAAPLGENDERQDYLRATLDHSADGLPRATPFARQDSSLLKTLARADCLIVRPPFAPAARTGDRVCVMQLTV